MPRVIFSDNAIKDFKRLRAFLEPKNPIATQKASGRIDKAISMIEDNPYIGKPVEGGNGVIRDLFIRFGISGYVLRYAYKDDFVRLLAVRHGKESGFKIYDD